MSTLQDPFLLHRKQAAELYLIRHGDAIPGPEELIPSGIYDNLPLSNEGRQQARKLATRLQSSHFDIAYSSPLRRCLETAQPLLSALQLSPSIIDNLKEIYTEGVTSLPQINQGDDPEPLVKALQERQMEIVRRAGNSGSWDSISTGGETSKAFRQRVTQAIDQIAYDNIGKRVLVFCHGAVINAYAAVVLGLDKEFFFPCANTSITVIRVNTDTRVLYVMNDIAHLIES